MNKDILDQIYNRKSKNESWNKDGKCINNKSEKKINEQLYKVK